jgi:hypothetical protein
MEELPMYVTKQVTAAGQWTDPIYLSEFFNYSGQGTEGITVTLQRSLDGGASYEDFDSNVTPFSHVGFSATSAQRDVFESIPFRLGVKTGETVSGSVDLTLGI